MKVQIDLNQLDKLGIPEDVLFYLISMYYDKCINMKTFSKAKEDGYILYDALNIYGQPIKAELTPKGTQLVEDLLIKSEFNDNSIERFIALADKLRELYPKGKKEGTQYTWRESSAIIAKRLMVLIKRTGVQFTDEEAIEATRKYVESFNGNYTYMKLLKYFIIKMDNNKVDEEGKIVVEETSELLNYISNLKDMDNSTSDNGELV